MRQKGVCWTATHLTWAWLGPQRGAASPTAQNGLAAGGAHSDLWSTAPTLGRPADKAAGVPGLPSVTPDDMASAKGLGCVRTNAGASMNSRSHCQGNRSLPQSSPHLCFLLQIMYWHPSTILVLPFFSSLFCSPDLYLYSILLISYSKNAKTYVDVIHLFPCVLDTKLKKGVQLTIGT